MPDTRRILLLSSKFRIQIGEDNETNPLLYGRELAEWLQTELRNSYAAIEEVIPEDCGWCVVCERKPHRLFIVVVNIIDQELVDAIARQESPEEVLWYVEPFVRVSFWHGRETRRKLDQALERLYTRVQEVLAREQEIRVLSEVEIEERSARYLDDINIPEELMPPVKPVSRWITLPLGLFLLPILLLSAIGGASLFVDPVENFATARAVGGTVILAACFGLAVIVYRLITGHENKYGGLFSPNALKGFAILSVLAAITLAGVGLNIDEPIRGLAGAVFWVSMAAALWRTATGRIRRAEAKRKSS